MLINRLHVQGNGLWMGALPSRPRPNQNGASTGSCVWAGRRQGRLGQGFGAAAGFYHWASVPLPTSDRWGHTNLFGSLHLVNQVKHVLSQVWLLFIVCGCQMWWRVENYDDRDNTNHTNIYSAHKWQGLCWVLKKQTSFCLIPTTIWERLLLFSFYITELRFVQRS